jgi:hydrogenase maturation protein HypF
MIVESPSNPSDTQTAPGQAGSHVVRLRLAVGGAVQGVGFRPYVYRLAVQMGLTGWVQNSRVGVTVEAEGTEAVLGEMRQRIEAEPPAGCQLSGIEATWLDPVGYQGFVIRDSAAGMEGQVWVRPDAATCPACVEEIFDPSNRRYGYAFTNCTACGPRYSIMESVPYDRARTSMKTFSMCPTCRAEYEDPGNRRFHAQPNACPVCGPQLSFWSPEGSVVATRADALARAVRLLQSGQILALKGLGGFQLLVDATSEEAVRRLRRRKHREEKPVALLFHRLEAVEKVCQVSAAEARLLQGPEAPIVLLRRRNEPKHGLAESVAPGNPWLGVMLPYTPLHHLLLAAAEGPWVATSGNLSDEPICIDEAEAAVRLQGIADGFLVHDRPIVRPVDDSVVRFVAGRETVLRRARGYVPLPIGVAPGLNPTPVVLAVGGQLKNTVGLGTSTGIFLSQHIGDLENMAALQVFNRVCRDLPQLLEVVPQLVISDLHPDYRSTREAHQMPLPCRAVQHHHAHVLACMAENQLDGPVLGIAWDGTGWGPDGTIWGGESLWVTNSGYRRFASLRPFPLPGGERAMREPRRAALGLLWELWGPKALAMDRLPPVASFTPAELRVVRAALERGVNCPRTSSMGRLFDAVSSLSGLRQLMSFEGQAAMELESTLDPDDSGAPYETVLEANPHRPSLVGQPCV